MDGFKKFPGVIKESIEYGIKHKIVFMLVISSGLWCFAISGVEMLWQPYTKEITGFSFQPWMLGVLGAGYFFSGALGHFLSSKTCKLFNNSYALILMAFRICMGAVLFVMANSSNVQGFALFYWLLFLLNGIITSPHATIFNQNVESKNRSTLISFESFVLQIGGLLGSLIFGHISKNYSISTSWMIGGTALILSSLCYFRVLGHEKDLQVEAVNN
jgi:predicted MFS family arabinose efflux permease